MPTVDPYWGNVVFLCQPSGTQGSSVFTDIKGHAITSYGSVRHEPLAGLFGGMHLFSDGLPNYIESISPDYALGSSNFTFEDSFLIPSSSQVDGFADIFSISTSDSSYELAATVQTYGDRVLTFYYRDSNGALASASVSGVAAQAWHNIKFSCVDGMLKLYIDGTQRENIPTTYAYTGQRLRIGRKAPAAFYGTAYHNNIRLTKGVGRYSGNITNSYTLYPAIGARIAGVVRDESENPCARTVRSYDRATGTLLGSTVSNAITGAFEIYSANADPQTVIILDDDAGSELDAIVYDRVIPETL